MSKKTEITPIPILNFILGIVAVLDLYLLFTSVLFNMLIWGTYGAAFALVLVVTIPVGGIMALLFGLLTILTKDNAKTFGWLVLIGGLVVLIGAIYIFIQPGISSLAGIGLWLEMIVGSLLVVFGLLQALGQ